MDTNSQRFLNLFTTLRAKLRRVSGIDLDYSSASVRRFVGEILKEFTPTCISNAFAQMPVLNHAFDIQRFHIDSLISSYVEISNFMQKVFSLIRYFLMGFSHKDLCFTPSAGTSDLSGQCPLSSSQDLLGLPEEFRVINTSASRVNQKFLDADINSDLGNSFRYLFGRYVIAGEAYKPLAGRGASDGDGFDIAFDRSGQKQLKPSDAGDIQVPSFDLVSGLLQGEGVVSVFTLEPGEPCFFSFAFDPAKEGIKGLLQSFYHVLQHLRSYSLKLRESSLKLRKLILLVNTGDRFSMLPVDVDSLLKSKVEEYAARIEPLEAFGFGLFIYLGSVLEGFSHFSLRMRQRLFGQALRLKGQSHERLIAIC